MMVGNACRRHSSSGHEAIHPSSTAWCTQCLQAHLPLPTQQPSRTGWLGALTNVAAQVSVSPYPCKHGCAETPDQQLEGHYGGGDQQHLPPPDAHSTGATQSPEKGL